MGCLVLLVLSVAATLSRLVRLWVLLLMLLLWLLLAACHYLNVRFTCHCLYSRRTSVTVVIDSLRRVRTERRCGCSGVMRGAAAAVMLRRWAVSHTARGGSIGTRAEIDRRGGGVVRNVMRMGTIRGRGGRGEFILFGLDKGRTRMM